MRPRPYRGRILRAIELTRRDRGAALVPEDISVDAAHMLISAVNRQREEKEDCRQRYILRQLVREIAPIFDLDPSRRYIYEVVTMRYYSLMSQLVARHHRMQHLASAHPPP